MTETESERDELETLALRDKLMEAAKKVRSRDELIAFLDTFQDYPDDYNFAVYRPAAAAIAATWAHAEGITGFQAGAIQWEIIRLWDVFDGKAGLHMQQYIDLLYPQYEAKFTTIPASVWEKVQRIAAENLASESMAAETVRAHWQTIVDGKVPFGLGVQSGA